MTYIYRITNNINGKTYIGQRKLRKGKTPIKDGYMGSGSYLKNAQKKYGIKNFSKEIITCFFGDTENKHTDAAEIYYIMKERELRGTENIYNIADGGLGNIAWNKGKNMPHTEEWNKNIGKSLLENTNGKGNNYWLGKKFSENHKNKIGAASKGRKHSDETIQKIKDGQNNISVLCVETNISYSSIGEAMRYTGANHISKVINGKLKTSGGYHWQKKILDKEKTNGIDR